MTATILSAAEPITGPAGVAGNRRVTLGVSSLYLALYLHYGFFAFIPLWLKAMGAAPGEIGVLMAIPLGLRLLTVAPLLGLGRSAWARARCDHGHGAALGRTHSAAAAQARPCRPYRGGTRLFDHVGPDPGADRRLRGNGGTRARARFRANAGVGLDCGGDLERRRWMDVRLDRDHGAAVARRASSCCCPRVVAPMLAPDRTMAHAEAGPTGRWRDVIADRKLLRAMAVGVAHHG